jgi:hypothetical protein
VRVLRTDLDGTVVLRTDGRSLRWSGWTPEHGWRPIERAAWAPQPGPLHRAAAALHAEDHWARAQRYLAEALASVHAQTIVPLEILLVDGDAQLQGLERRLGGRLSERLSGQLMRVAGAHGGHAGMPAARRLASKTSG